MSNPNNCEMCGHKDRPEGGHCYMFRNEPDGVCMAHTARNDSRLMHQLLDAGMAGLIATGMNTKRNKK